MFAMHVAYSMYCLSYRFFDHLTYFMNFLQSNCIDIESLMSQKIFENFEIHNDIIKSWCDSHFHQYRIIQTQNICFMMYRQFKFRYQISYRCFIAWKHIQNVFNHSIAIFTNRFYVIFEINKSSNFDSFVIAIFASMYDLTLQNLRHLKSLFKNFKQYIAEKIKIYIVEKISEFVVLKKLVRKFQNTHRWENLHENFKLNSLKYWTENTNDCCEKMLKIQFSQMCCNQDSIDIIWRKKN